MNPPPTDGPTPPARSYQTAAIRPEMTVRQVAAQYPACREIFCEYGEPTDRTGVDGAPGPFGHFQPLDRFAADRDVDLEELLRRLGQAAGVPVERHRAAAERIHHGFIYAALAITLSLGAAWGGYLLFAIGRSQDFVAVDAAHVIAHGEAQLWGFIVLFIVGISLRTLLKDAASTRSGQQLCWTALFLALVSLVGGFAWSLAPQRLTIVGVGSAGMLLVLSAALWAVQWRVAKSKWNVTWARAVFMSGFWLVVWAIVTIYLRVQAGSVGPDAYSYDDRSLIIKLAVFGFAMNSIYGFGQMLLPGLLRIGKPRLGAIEASFWLHNSGVLLMVIASLAAESSSRLIALLAEPIGATAVLSAALCYAVGQRGLIGKARTSNRLEQGHWLLDVYPPLAFFWLIVSLVMLAGGALYVSMSGHALPHAFTGAVRHALTVGFMTTLILGVAQRLLPVLEHSVLKMPGLVAWILVCIGIGNLTRVSSQLATQIFPLAYTVMPISAIFEWIALVLFTISMVKQMSRRKTWRPGVRITAQTSLAELLAATPSLEDKLIQLGSAYLVRARSVPTELTVGSFATSEHQDPAELVAWLNEL